VKVIAFNGSARKDGNTAILIKHILSELENEGIETEMIQLGGLPIQGCKGCRLCYKNKNRQCSINDKTNGYIKKMDEADGIVLGSPVYFANMTPELKALIDRSGFVARANDHMFKKKVGCAVVAARRAGAIYTFNGINHFFSVNQMIIPGSSYWNVGFGKESGDVENDLEGINTMKDLGKNMAWLLKKIKNN
jgi:multimeric flavodoxin WrbA